MYPWDYCNELTEYRLTTIGNIIQDARNECVDYFLRERGTNWSLGCLAFDWVRNAIIDAAENGTHPWLSLDDTTLHFRFSIGNARCALFRGDQDDEQHKTVRSLVQESKQLSFDLGDDRIPVAWLFAIQVLEDGTVDKIVVVGRNADNFAICSWEIPLSGREIVRTIAEISAKPAEATDIPEPDVRLPGTEKKAKDEDDDGSS